MIWFIATMALMWTWVFYWLVTHHPMLTNPLAISRAIADGTIGQDTLQLLAALAPVLIWAIFALVWACLLILLGSVYREQRLHPAMQEDV
ncbi:MAG: hypothetical protein GKR94_22050 [Gammaproteobacteria bacterium]|nr:hypothetical protein [Gammaproteobacteria bacterium]